MKLLTIIFIFITPVFFFAQNATIQGIVKDINTNEPLIGANIFAGETGTVTDEKGAYTLYLSPRKYRLEVSYVSYTKIVTSIEVKANDNLTKNFSLEVEEILLQTTTVTSGRYEKPLGEVTVSLEVLKPTLLESNNTVNISSILEKVPGVSVIDGQANIRGGSGYSYGAGSRVLLLLDDIPILTADAGFPNWQDIPVENIAQIEVVKGAASALYGSSALNGVINVRTAYAKAEPETKVAAFYTAFFKPQNRELAWWDTPPYQIGTSVNHRRKIDKLDLVVGGLFSSNSGFIQDETPNVKRQGNFRDFGRFNANLRYRLNDRLSFGVNTIINQGKSKDFFFWKDIDNLYIGSIATISEGTQSRFNIDPFLTYFDKLGNRHKLLGRLYNTDNQFSNNQSTGSKLYYGEYQYQRNFEPIKLVTTAGIVGMRASTSAELYGNNEYRSSNIAAYLQLERKFFERLNISSGFRWERNTIFNSAFLNAFTAQEVPEQSVEEAKPVFRVGANYQAAAFTYLRASYGQGYRFPTIAEKFISTVITGGIQAVPNPDLRSETGWSSEIGIKQGFRISGFEGFIDISAFWSEYQDMMEFNLAFNPRNFRLGFQSKNIGNTIVKGIDFTIAGRGALFGLPTTLLAGYVYIDPRFEEFDLSGKALTVNRLETATLAQLNAWSSSVDYNILKYRFQHSATFDMESKIKNLSLGLAANFNSHMEAIDALIEFDDRIVPNAKQFRDTHNNGFFILGARVGYNFTPKIKLSMVGNNLTNTEYAVRVGVMNAPRNVALRLDMSF